ncbi:entericidin A/B family lipoprotein [Akkermansiaceae bacterium]|nr:entericidin A/B family lipoprotein [Akkermansiaceae bacterium]
MIICFSWYFFWVDFLVISKPESLDQPQPESNLMKKIAIVLSAFAFLAVSSCQTMKGLGRDIGGAGQKLENAANR